MIKFIADDFQSIIFSMSKQGLSGVCGLEGPGITFIAP